MKAIFLFNSIGSNVVRSMSYLREMLGASRPDVLKVDAGKWSAATIKEAVGVLRRKGYKCFAVATHRTPHERLFDEVRLTDMPEAMAASMAQLQPPTPPREGHHHRTSRWVSVRSYKRRGQRVTESIDSVEAEVRAKLRAGQMRGVTYKSVFRVVGSTRAVVDIMGQRFSIDDSTRLAKQAGMRQVGGRGDSHLPELKTSGDINAYFNKYPKLGPEDFALQLAKESTTDHFVVQHSPPDDPDDAFALLTVLADNSGGTESFQFGSHDLELEWGPHLSTFLADQDLTTDGMGYRFANVEDFEESSLSGGDGRSRYYTDYELEKLGFEHRPSREIDGRFAFKMTRGPNKGKWAWFRHHDRKISYWPIAPPESEMDTSFAFFG